MSPALVTEKDDFWLKSRWFTKYDYVWLRDREIKETMMTTVTSNATKQDIMNIAMVVRIP